MKVEIVTEGRLIDIITDGFDAGGALPHFQVKIGPLAPRLKAPRCRLYVGCSEYTLLVNIALFTIRVDGFFRTNAILEFRMGFVRSTLAFPFYVLAFVFHLLTALFTVIAQKIAGEESGPPRRKKTVSHVMVAAFAIAAAPALVSLNPSTTDVSRLAPQAAMDYRAIKAEFTPEQMAWIKPLIRLTACIFAENAIRHKLEPMPVSFSPCGGGAVHAALDDNLIDVIVSGIATAGAIERPFTVTLQHYPSSTDENGFITLSIQIDTNGILVSDGAT